MNYSQKMRLAYAYSVYLEEEFGRHEDAYGESDELVKEINRDRVLHLAYSTLRGHDIQADYSIDNEQYEYFVDCELVVTEKTPIEQAIKDLNDRTWDCYLEPCVNYLDGIYLDLDEKAKKMLKADVVEVGRDDMFDMNYCVLACYFTPTFKQEAYRVNRIEDLPVK